MNTYTKAESAARTAFCNLLANNIATVMKTKYFVPYINDLGQYVSSCHFTFKDAAINYQWLAEHNYPVFGIECLPI